MPALLILAWSNNLAPVVALLVAIDFAAGFAYLWFRLRVMPALPRQLKWKFRNLRPLLQFGGWMTVSNVVSPLMFTMDRFLIATLISVGAVDIMLSRTKRSRSSLSFPPRW